MKAGKGRAILGNISVVNVALAAVLIVFAGYSLPSLMNKSVKLRLPAPRVQATPPKAATDKPDEGKSPSPADYFLVADRNLFNPERKMPVEKKEVAQPLPTPEFVLYGTLLVDDLHIAYMEDRKAPQNTPTRGKKQIPLRPGESLSGFTVKEIEPSKVVMVRGEERLVVSLDDETKSKDRGGPPAPAKGAPAVQAPVQGKQAPASTEAERRRRRAQFLNPSQAAQQNPSTPEQVKAANKLLNFFKRAR